MAILARRAALALTAAAMLIATAAAQAQTYPNRDVRFIVPFGAGGSTDVIARQFATQLEKELPGNLNVENKPGGSGSIGASMIVQAKPDGYTIGVVPSEVLTYQPLVHTGLPYKTPDDYQPIVKLGDRPSVLFVRADAPWKTFEDFMAEAKKNPGKIRASVPGVGTLSDLVIQEFNKVAGVKIVTIPFTGGGSEAMVALLGGRVEAFVGSVSGNLGQVQAGRMRALAVFQKGKNDVLPDATSVVDAGYNVTLQVAFYVVAPKGLPKDVQDKLVAASARVARSDEFIQFTKKNDFTVDVKETDAARTALAELQAVFASLIEAAK